MRKVSALLVLLLLALTYGPAMAANEGIVSGTVVNKTTGAPAAGLKVNLHTFDAQGEKGQQATQTDASGRFTFAGLSTATELAYALSVNYKDVAYSTSPTKFEANTTSLSLDVPVYETTNDGSGLKVRRGHLLIFPQKASMTIGEFMEVENSGNSTVIASPKAGADGKNGTLLVSLPPGAKNVTAGESGLQGTFTVGDGWVLDARPLFPGPNSIIFYYEFPYSAPNFELTKKLDYSVEDFNVLAGDVGQGVTSAQLQAQDKIDSKDGKYLRLNGKGLVANTEITVQMNNIPENLPDGAGTSSAAIGQAAPASQQGSLYQILVVALSAVLLAFGGAYLLRRERARPKPVLAPAAAVPQISEEGMASLLALAALDDAFESGQIGEEEYRRQREAQKRRVAESLQ